jgi:hypothetical protein
VPPPDAASPTPPEEPAADDDPDAPEDLPAVAPDGPTNGLAQLVLTLIKLLHDLLEKQAIRRMDAGRLSDEEVERVGRTLQRQAQEIEHLCDVFGLEERDLTLDLGTVQALDPADLDASD